MDNGGGPATISAVMLQLLRVALGCLLISAVVQAATSGRMPGLAIDPSVLQQIPGRLLQPQVRRPVQQSLTLTASSTRVQVGATVQFQASIRPGAPASAIYYFSVDGRLQPGAPHGSTYQKRFERPGTHAVSVKANLGPDSPELNSNVVVVTVEQPPPIHYSLQLSPRGSTRIQAGQAVDFYAYLSPDTPADTRYTFRVDGNPVRGPSRANSYHYTFDRPGSYRVTATARPGPSGTSVSSNSVTVQVARPLPPPPRVSISPPYRSVFQGDSAEFFSVADPDRGSIASYRWHGANNQTSNLSTFRPDTGNLAAGRYPIDLTVRDSHGQPGQASATLEVKVRPRPHQPPRAVITAIRDSVRQGESASYESHSTVDRDGSLRLLWTGPDGQRTHNPRFDVNTSRLPPGDYTVSLRATDEEGYSDTARAPLRVLMPPGRLAAAINPPVLSVPWGRTVQFHSASTIPPGSEPDLTWHGPGGRPVSGPVYEIDTATLVPGDFQVALQLRLGDGRRGQATARLIVTAPRLGLTTDRATAQPGETIRFRTAMSSTRYPQQYVLHFGDGAVTTLNGSASRQHAYADPGSYRAQLVTTIHGRTFQSDPVEIRVAAGAPGVRQLLREPPDARLRWPSPVWLIPLLVVLAGMAVYRLWPRAAVAPPVIDVRAVPDGQGPTIVTEKTPGPHIELVLVKDPGEQSWEPVSAGEEADHG